jgi:hypothetical protein
VTGQHNVTSTKQLCRYDATPRALLHCVLRASNTSPILTMSRAFQIVTYIITWSSFLVAIASCILRIHCCRCIKRSWKADDFMSLVVGVSARFELISKTRRLICRLGVPCRSAGPLATCVPDGLRWVSDDIGTTTMVLTRQQTRAKRLQLPQAKRRCSDGSFPRDPRDSS